MEYFINDERNGDSFPEDKLLERHENKEEVRKAIKSCLEEDLYVHSNQFKYLLLMFRVGVEKRHEALKKELKELFFSRKAVEVLINKIPDNMVIIKGFSLG